MKPIIFTLILGAISMVNAIPTPFSCYSALDFVAIE